MFIKYHTLKKNVQEKFNWVRHARPSQRIPKGLWRTWLILAGRGFGKTRTGAETLKRWVQEGKAKRIALVGETAHDVRHVMIEGSSGLFSVYPSWERPHYESSKRLLTWPNGSVAQTFSGDTPCQLRGPQFDAAWVDELAKFKNPEKTWNQLMMGLRLGDNPRAIITTTPRPLKLLKTLIASPAVHVTRGSTFENEAHLATGFLEEMQACYSETRLGLQELYAELLENERGALWRQEMIQGAHDASPSLPFTRIVVALDPAVTSKSRSDETGIIVAGLDQEGRGVVLEDLSMKGSPSQWIQVAIAAYDRFQADRIVAEVNQGGDMVEDMLRAQDSRVSFKAVRATRGKAIRAEPIAALYERGKILHAKVFPTLEAQLIGYLPQSTKKSPDRMDALVWAMTELMLGNAANHPEWWR
ncbi:DNA-packaging protein [Candidatus Bealeia paramacronuclearis]|uniref:DNA-packaging protein n=1 Tax=Candidatus Bealeia paramacronuclearis TaxID=1921001 RepID=UPI002F26CB1D